MPRSPQMIHNTIVAMRKEFDSLTYSTDLKEGKKLINREKNTIKKQKENDKYGGIKEQRNRIRRTA